MPDGGSTETKAGFVYGIIAYTCWGLIPLYFAQVKHVRPEEILAHRIVWSLGIMLTITAIMKRWSDLQRILTSSRLMLTLVVSSLLLATNWLLYIYATVNNRVSEASLGYYMMPLVNAFLGSVFLGERLRPWHYPALALVAAAVAVPAVVQGSMTWLSVMLPISFGIYGVVRKRAPVDSLTGLTVESLILTVPSAGLIAYRQSTGLGAFAVNVHDSFWLMCGGIATVVPLLTYTLSIRRLPLLAVSFIQFISPTLQIILAVVILKEVVTWDRWTAIGLVITAVVIFLADAIMVHRARERGRRELSGDEADYAPRS